MTEAGAALLDAAITRYAREALSGMIRVGCPHAGPGVPCVLFLDAARPAVVCVPCLGGELAAIGAAHAELCRLCGTGARRFDQVALM